MAHYFDDIFQRSVEVGVPQSPQMHRIRRSSTARSIGARSDFVLDDHDHDDGRSDGASVSDGIVLTHGAGAAREKTEADAHMHAYISDQLSRYKDEMRTDRFSHADEFEASANGNGNEDASGSGAN